MSIFTSIVIDRINQLKIQISNEKKGILSAKSDFKFRYLSVYVSINALVRDKMRSLLLHRMNEDNIYVNYYLFCDNAIIVMLNIVF